MLLSNADQMLLALLSARPAGLSSVSTGGCAVHWPLHPRPSTLGAHSAFFSHHRREHSLQFKDLFEPSMNPSSIKHN